MIMLLVTLDTDLDTDDDLEQYAQWIADQFPFSTRIQHFPSRGDTDDAAWPEILVVEK